MRCITRLAVLSLCVAVMCSPSLFAADNEASVGLNEYKLVLGPKVIKGVDDDASGLTFNSETKTLFVAINGAPMLVELDLQGDFKRTIRLKSFEDTEGVCWISGDKYAVIEERRRNLVVMDISKEAESVDYETALTFLIEPVAAGNLGIEGLTRDPKGQRFFIVKEKNPRKIYEVKIPAEQGAKAIITTPWDIEKAAFGMTDLAGIHYDTKTGHLLILSDESKCVVECTVDGKKMVSRLFLKEGSAGLTRTLQQPEGITMDDSGNLYICSEPNVLYVFARQAKDPK